MIWLLLMLAGWAYAGQATLPKTIEAERSIGDIEAVPIGTSGYMSCWGLHADMDRHLWVNKKFSLWKTRDAFSAMHVIRTADGVVIEMSEPCCRQIPSNGLILSSYLPVMSFACKEEEKSWWHRWLP
jgi:hypothetical protein